MYLVQILLPLNYPEGVPFARELFRSVQAELADRFAGLTAYTRAPAEGIWKPDSARAERDEIVIYEVMVPTIDHAWWSDFRQRQESTFKQESIVVRAAAIEML